MNGRLIVIEGLDGSGKATQAAALSEHFQKQDKPVLKLSFPDYGSESSALVKLYLSGALGGLDEVNVYAASSFYAVDRYASFAANWKKQYESGYTIIADRYATSNIVHQMPKLPETEWEAYIKWLEDFEYAKMRLPRPDVVVFLDMMAVFSRDMMDKRYGNHDRESRDIHERDTVYQMQCRRAAHLAAKRLGWKTVRCYDDTGPLAIDFITGAIVQAVQEGNRER